LVLVALTMIISSTSVQAQDRPIQIALFTPVQIVPEDIDIKGFRFDVIYGRNASVTGFDVGLVNHTTTGLSKGIQFSFIGLNESDFIGWQHGFVNITKGNFEGLQVGVVNYANQMKGVQFGLVNYAGSGKGLQIGLVNIIKEGGAFPVFPIVNWTLCALCCSMVRGTKCSLNEQLNFK